MRRKPVKMWALWYDDEATPVEVHRCRSAARMRSGGIWSLRVVRVEISPARKAKAKKRARAAIQKDI